MNEELMQQDTQGIFGEKQQEQKNISEELMQQDTQDIFDFENIVLKGHNGCEQLIQEEIENISYYDILIGENSITQQGNDAYYDISSS